MTAQVAHSVAHSAPSLHSRAAGRTAPAFSPEVLSITASGRPSKLNDREWLAARCAQDGDRTIAQELGCAPLTVRRARERFGISPSVGRRRGRSLQAVPADGQEKSSAGEMVLTGTALAMVTRFNEDQKHFGGAPATERLLAKRIIDYHEAKLAGDHLAEQDALLAIASAAGLIHQHNHRLRKR